MKSALCEIKNAQNLESTTKSILSNISEYDIRELILPEGEKNFYFECAYVLSNLPCNIISMYATELMSWFQDLNWPGVKQIYTALRNLPVDVLVSALQKAYQNAVEDADEEWMYNLNEQFQDILSENTDQGTVP